MKKSMGIRNEGARHQAINDFWGWFTANIERLMVLYDSGRLEELGEQLSREIDKIEPQLAWELGPGKHEPNLFTISGEGNPDLRHIADLVVQLAPPLKGWEFYSSRPPRPAPEVVRLPANGEIFVTSQWEFVPLEQPASGRLDLIIVDDPLAQAYPESAMKAVSIYLDELLGEDIVERWIGRFEITSHLTLHGKTTYKIAELPDYLEWATNRSDNPLVRHDVH